MRRRCCRRRWFLRRSVGGCSRWILCCCDWNHGCCGCCYRLTIVTGGTTQTFELSLFAIGLDLVAPIIGFLRDPVAFSCFPSHTKLPSLIIGTRHDTRSCLLTIITGFTAQIFEFLFLPIALLRLATILRLIGDPFTCLFFGLTIDSESQSLVIGTRCYCYRCCCRCRCRCGGC